MKHLVPMALAFIVPLTACDPAGQTATSPELASADAPALNRAGGWDAKVTGGGNWARVGGLVFGEFEISAHSLNGEVRGHASVTADQTQLGPAYANFELAGEVTCVTVSGNRATVGFRIDEGSITPGALPFPLIGSGIMLTIEDNGPPRGDPSDRLTNSGIFADGNNLNCVHQLPFDTPYMEPITSGNIVLHTR